MILIVFLNDIIMTSNCVKEIKRLKDFLGKEFKIKDLGALKYFLGMEVARSKSVIAVTQRKCTLDKYVRL